MEHKLAFLRLLALLLNHSLPASPLHRATSEALKLCGERRARQLVSPASPFHIQPILEKLNLHCRIFLFTGDLLTLLLTSGVEEVVGRPSNSFFLWQCPSPPPNQRHAANDAADEFSSKSKLPTMPSCKLRATTLKMAKESGSETS